MCLAIGVMGQRIAEDWWSGITGRQLPSAARRAERAAHRERRYQQRVQAAREAGRRPPSRTPARDYLSDMWALAWEDLAAWSHRRHDQRRQARAQRQRPLRTAADAWLERRVRRPLRQRAQEIADRQLRKLALPGEDVRPKRARREGAAPGSAEAQRDSGAPADPRPAEAPAATPTDTPQPARSDSEAPADPRPTSNQTDAEAPTAKVLPFPSQSQAAGEAHDMEDSPAPSSEPGDTAGPVKEEEETSMTDVSVEVTGLASAQQWARQMVQSLERASQSIETARTGLSNGKVTGQPLSVLASLEENFTAALANARRLVALLAEQEKVADAHRAVEHAGDKGFLTGE